MIDKSKNFFKRNWFVLTIILLAVVKQLMITSIPIAPYPNQVYDDNMMVEMAKNIRAGNWLGAYSSNVLVKGMMCPLLLAIINYFGLSYINTMNFIYTIACIYFLYTIKDLLKSKISLIVIFTVLLFNPVSYAWWTLQRVYRNGITLAQVLVIIGSLFAMYQRRDEALRKMVPFSIIGGLTLASLWLTREDGIWILPFTLVVILILLCYILVRFLKNKQKKTEWKMFLCKCFVAVLPFIILIGALNINKAINYSKYGVYEYNELSNGYFGKVIHIIYSVKTDEDIQYVTATRKKINEIYKYSETLSCIKDELEASMDAWDYNDRTRGDTQVEDGWFLWALKEAAEKANKYTDAKTSNEFYKKVYEEISKAIDDGKLETQFSMPSNLMSPWKSRYFTELPKAIIRISWYVVNFEDVKTIYYSGDIPNDDAGVGKFEALTNDLAATNHVDNSVDNATKYSEKYVNRLNFIGQIYKNLGLVVTVLGVISYLILTVVLIKEKNLSQLLDSWLLLTGIICSFIVLIIGVSYSHITAFFSMYYMYLSGAYPLLGAFDMISIAIICERIYKRRKLRDKKTKDTK